MAHFNVLVRFILFFSLFILFSFYKYSIYNIFNIIFSLGLGEEILWWQLGYVYFYIYFCLVITLGYFSLQNYAYGCGFCKYAACDSLWLNLGLVFILILGEKLIFKVSLIFILIVYLLSFLFLIYFYKVLNLCLFDFYTYVFFNYNLVLLDVGSEFLSILKGIFLLLFIILVLFYNFISYCIQLYFIAAGNRCYNKLILSSYLINEFLYY